MAVDHRCFMISAAVDTDYVRGFAFGCRELGKRSISAILESVILAGSLRSRTKTLGASRCITLLYVTGVRLGRESSVITDRRLPV